MLNNWKTSSMIHQGKIFLCVLNCPSWLWRYSVASASLLMRCYLLETVKILLLCYLISWNFLTILSIITWLVILVKWWQRSLKESVLLLISTTCFLRNGFLGRVLIKTLWEKVVFLNRSSTFTLLARSNMFPSGC